VCVYLCACVCVYTCERTYVCMNVIMYVRVCACVCVMCVRVYMAPYASDIYHCSDTWCVCVSVCNVCVCVCVMCVCV